MAGLAEGADEIPVGACFPLEYNLDFCNGGMPTCSFFGDVSNFFLFLVKVTSIYNFVGVHCEGAA